MEGLPLDIIALILAQLSPAFGAIASLTCKRWLKAFRHNLRWHDEVVKELGATEAHRKYSCLSGDKSEGWFVCYRLHCVWRVWVVRGPDESPLALWVNPNWSWSQLEVKATGGRVDSQPVSKYGILRKRTPLRPVTEAMRLTLKEQGIEVKDRLPNCRYSASLPLRESLCDGAVLQRRVVKQYFDEGDWAPQRRRDQQAPGAIPPPDRLFQEGQKKRE